MEVASSVAKVDGDKGKQLLLAEAYVVDKIWACVSRKVLYDSLCTNFQKSAKKFPSCHGYRPWENGVLAIGLRHPW